MFLCMFISIFIVFSILVLMLTGMGVSVYVY